MEVKFLVPTNDYGLVDNGKKEAKEEQGVKVWSVVSDDGSYPAQADGCTPWVKCMNRYVCVEFLEKQ